MLDRSIPTREALVHSYKGGFCYVPTVYIFLKYYNISLFKKKKTKRMDMSSLQTQEFVYTWLVQIFMKNKTFTFDSEISVVDSVVKPRQVDGVGAVITAPPFEFVFLPSSSPSGFVFSSSPRLPRLVLFYLSPCSSRTQRVVPCVLSSKFLLWLLGLSSLVLSFGCFSVIVVLLSGASVERECVLADVEEGDREQIKVESVLLSQCIGSLRKFR
jgi:hypothetical protein